MAWKTRERIARGRVSKEGGRFFRVKVGRIFFLSDLERNSEKQKGWGCGGREQESGLCCGQLKDIRGFKRLECQGLWMLEGEAGSVENTRGWLEIKTREKRISVVSRHGKKRKRGRKREREGERERDKEKVRDRGRKTKEVER